MSWAEEYGDLTVEQAIELNEVAKWYCGHEIITNSKEI